MRQVTWEGIVFTSVPGIYRGGKIELIEQPKNISDETRVIVTFLNSGAVDLRSHGIDEDHARELRERLGTFADDWDSPEMSIYDNYDAIWKLISQRRTEKTMSRAQLERKAKER